MARWVRAASVSILVLPATAGYFPGLAGPQDLPPPVAPSEPPTRSPDKVPPAASAIVVDGRLDEEAWAGALALELPYEVWPADSTDAAVRTVAHITYDADRVYVGFEAHDPDPHIIRARLSDRDAAFQDDFVGVVLDTFNDGRRAYEFFANAMGVQMDLVVDDVSGNEDSSWDAIWESAGQLTEGGYNVEIAIPYTSLRFQRAEGGQVWGLDLIRIYPRDQRYMLASNPRDRDISCYLCQVGKVIGFDGATPGRNLEIAPTVTAIRTDQAEATGESVERGSPDYEAGVTARWGITPNMVVSGTINPDFSQVEADVAQLDVNEQFALFFPEKRPFFLEGADFFETPINIVHTRTIADPSWGMKLTGKEGANAMGVFAVEDDLTNVLFPGSQGSSSASLEAESIAGVARYRRDIGKSSAVGGLVTVRDGEGYSSGVAGVDGLFRPASSHSIRAQALVSRTTYPEDLALEFEQPEGDFGDTAYALNYNHSTRNWYAWARYLDIGPDFRADLGFVPQVDIRQPVVGTEYQWFADPNAWHSRIGVGADWDRTAERDGTLIEEETEGWSYLAGPRQSFFLLGGGFRDRAFRSEVFSQTFLNFFFEVQPMRDIYFNFEVNASDRVDFAFDDPSDPEAARQGDELRWETFFRYNIGRRVRLELTHEQRRLEIPEGRLFLAALSQFRLAYQINRRTFVRAIVQYQDVDRDVDLYPECVLDPTGCDLRPASENLFTQLLFSYKVNPQTAVYLGYTDNRSGLEQFVDDPANPGGPPVLDDIGITRTDQTFFFKVGYAFVR